MCVWAEVPAWYFWLLKPNMWQSSWKADLCQSFYKLMFKSTNAHLQLLLFSFHLFSLLTHTHTHMRSILQKYCYKDCWTEKQKILHSSFHQVPVKFRPQYADGTYGWWCIIFKEHKRRDAMITSLIKVLLESVKSLISRSPTYQLPHHQLNTMWEAVVACILSY